MLFRTFFGLLLVAIMISACARDEPPSTMPPTEDVVKVKTQLPAQAATTPLASAPTPAPTSPPVAEEQDEEVTWSTTVLPPYYGGNATLEERIAGADVIAYVRMVSVEAVTTKFVRFASTGGTLAPASQPYVGALKYTFDVVEYLKPSDTTTPNRITAIVGSLDDSTTASEAQTEANRMLSARNTQWDTHGALVFLLNESDAYPATNASDLYYMSIFDFEFGFGDMYTVASDRNRIWLPSTTPIDSSRARSPGDIEFYLEQPTVTSRSSISSKSAVGTESTLTAQTIGLSAMKTKVSTVDAMIVDGSRKHKLCVIAKLTQMRKWEYGQRVYGKEPKTAVEQHYAKNIRIRSGQPAGTKLFTSSLFTKNENADDWQGNSWLEGEGADLFTVGEVERTFNDVATIPNSYYASGGDLLVRGQDFERPWETVRPLPQGVYDLTLKFKHALYVPCDAANDMLYEFPITVTVTTANPRTAHEALFDPVTDGSAVAADSSNGQLDPAAFTDANGASATVQRIEWASNTVKMKVNPHTGLAGHKLDFIALDGSVSLSLFVDEATIDAANMTLSWSVTPQPWHDGDLLMLRIAEVVPEVALVDVPSTVAQGSSESFTVKASGLSSADAYSIRLSTNNYAIGFDTGCGIVAKTVSVPSGSTSHSATIALHGCNVTTSTVTATLSQGTSTVDTATAEVEVEATESVTVTLSPRQEPYFTYTDMTVEWTDPSGCAGSYYVGIFNNAESVERDLGYHPAPATTSLSAEPSLYWDDIPNLDWFVRVRCHPSDNSGLTIVGQASLQSGLPSTP